MSTYTFSPISGLAKISAGTELAARLGGWFLLSKRSESCHREKIPSASGMRELPGTLRFLAASESGESQTS